MRLAQRTQQVVIQGYTDQGGWLITTGYVVDDLVNDTGVEYVCIVGHTSTAADRPGIGANWEDFWEVLDSSAVFDMEGYSKGIFHMPSAWDAADIGFLIGYDVDGAYLPLYDVSGTLVAITPVVDRSYAFPSSVIGAKYVKLWSHSAGTDVHQTADRTIQLDFKA